MSIAMAMSASGEWVPLARLVSARRWVLVASVLALAIPCLSVFQIGCWNRWMVRASLTNSPSRERRAQEIQGTGDQRYPPVEAEQAAGPVLDRK